MNPYWQQDNNRLYLGDALEVLKALPAESVHLVVTSPPYWGLRDYGVDGQLGLEETPEQFVQNLVEVFREVRRILRPDGTCWINLGSSYAGSNQGAGTVTPTPKQASNKGTEYMFNETHKSRLADVPGFKPKDLIPIPWMVAMALQSDGWWLRSACPWVKRSSMPESCTDRPASALEYMFLFSKSQQYYFDM